MIGVAAPDKVDKLYKQFRATLFPEDKYDELAYLRKVRSTMEKLRGKTINVMPVINKGKGGMKHVR
jgi:hypothetical protein